LTGQLRDRAMHEVTSLDEFVALVEDSEGGHPLYVRWTRDLDADLAAETSRDELTGIELPGLSANGLSVEPWWGERPLHMWLARKLFDYRHLPRRRGADTRAWVVTGHEAARSGQRAADRAVSTGRADRRPGDRRGERAGSRRTRPLGQPRSCRGRATMST
jgi:hypothetical protein